MIPGEIITPEGAADLPANHVFATRTIRVANTGDRPRRRSHHAHVADGAQDEGAVRHPGLARPEARGCR